MAEVRQCVSLLERVIYDLSQLQDRRFLTSYDLESFLTNIELVYRELVAIELLDELSTEQREGIDLVRQCLCVIRQIQLSTQLSEVSSSPTAVVCYTGEVGRPRYEIPEDTLEMLIENRFTVPQIANIMGVSISTVRRRMSDAHILIRDCYSTISDSELDHIVGHIQQQYPMCGNRQMQGHLISRGYRIQQTRLRDSQRRIDPVGTALRRLNAIHCRQYSVPSPLSLYHIDGHHKLIRWKIVVHGCVLFMVMTPIQLWIQGLSNGLFIDQYVVNQGELPYFGIDWDGPLSDEDTNYVNVPDVDNPLTDEDYLELQETISPLDNSNSFGVDIFLKVLQFVCHKLNLI